MIKETDASTCDERRVKNKLNPLTHKKKGETHIMGNQGMKNWKLGTFFVISLMLMAGLFTNTATFAQTQYGSVSVDPTEVTAEDDIKLEVTYLFNRSVTLTGDSTTIAVTFPTEWNANTFSLVEEPPAEEGASYVIVKLNGTVLSTTGDPTDLDGGLDAANTLEAAAHTFW